MGRFRRGFPLTSHMITQSMLGVLIRMAEIKSLVGRMEPYIKRAIVVETVIFLEQFLRLIAEELTGGKGGRTDEVVADVGERVSVRDARVSAVYTTFQSRKAVENIAERLRIEALARWLRDGGGAMLDMLYWTRHSLVHTVGLVRFDAARMFAAGESLVHALLAGRPREMVACRLVEGARMSAAGRAGDARAAYIAALAVCDGLPADQRGSAWACLSRGHALVRLGRYAEAEESCAGALEADPGSALAHLEMANVLALAGSPDKARAFYERSIAIDPRYLPARTHMGHALLMRPTGAGTLAVECYEEALRLSAEEMSAHTGLGLCLAIEGRYEDAAGRFRKAIDLDPIDASARTGLAHARAAMGDYSGAIETYRAAIRIAVETGFEDAARHRGAAV